ncbi:MAG: hypothetical protein Q9170_002905 [Blastenia crenularia]
MVSKKDGKEVHWLFPESLRYILDQQLPSGGWASYATKADGIVNTLAALLALARHRNDRDPNARLQTAILSATTYLDDVLQALDLDGNLSVGFEILVPAILRMLESQGGIYFTFPARSHLLEIEATKMKAFRPELLYGVTESTLLHSLEALIGKIDFDRIRHRKVFGSMMASPASTAACLMNLNLWDEEAEIYLRKVINEGPGKGDGAAPSAFPTPIFEVSWVFLCLRLLGYQVEAKPLVAHFKSENNRFRTYSNERDASLSANCNVLRGILETDNPDDHFVEIETTTQYLCESWWKGKMEDKWNISVQYSVMLLAETLVKLLEVWDRGYLTKLPEALLLDRLPVTLVQLLTQTLNDKVFEIAKSGEKSMEILAYAIITLKRLYPVPWLGTLSEETLSRIRQGQKSLANHSATAYGPQYVWVEKVTYSSFNLTDAYYLAAMRPPKSLYIWTEKVKNLILTMPTQEKKITHMFSKLRCFESDPTWKISASVVEGLTFLPQLRSSCKTILAGETRTAKNEYLSFIPCTWVIVNNIRKLGLDTYLLWDMMVLTLGNFRVDEWMETVTTGIDATGLFRIKQIIQTLCEERYLEKPEPINGINIDMTDLKSPPISPASAPAPEPSPAQSSVPQSLAFLDGALSPYISTILDHPRIRSHPSLNQVALRISLKSFLNSHTHQSITNLSFSTQVSPSLPYSDFANWLRDVSAPSVSAPFSFTFLTTLLDDLPSELIINYLSQKFSDRIAIMSRMYNDLGSLTRDIAEKNVNCANFLLDQSMRQSKEKETENDKKGSQLAEAKARLEILAAYERDAVDLAGSRLVDAILAGGIKSSVLWSGQRRKRERWANVVRLFLGVAELYADLYLMKDLSNKQQQQQKGEHVG